MHEASLVRDLIRKITAVAQTRGTGRVIGVRVRLGALSHISPEHFREHFTHGAHGTVAEGARLEIETMTATDDPLAQEVILDSIEVED
jgi:hydrogenase nickel incorporation protein HypA/HybF